MSRELPESVFAQVIEIESPEKRAAFLDQACGNDPELRREMEKLVLDHFRAGQFLERPVNHFVATVEQPSVERPGTMIGPYKLLEQIGEGGMGLVFVAEQTQPVRRKVALKLIKPGMDTRQVIARFEAERQALAIMDHPNIAKILDAGTTGEEPRTQRSEVSGPPEPLTVVRGSSRPYFVMELVKGTPITDYCDRHQLPTRQRLELFRDVCQAVQHAHQKGIIHRDLKPSNILVEVHDVRPVVKIIDFGIAKAIGQQLTDKTLYTGIAQMIGTPLYMSPEQAGLSSLDVDTRSDVYALGVLLYELLTGTTPFDGETLKKAGYDEMRRIVREDEPPKPSARLSTLHDQVLSTIAEQRGMEPRHLGPQMRGELDWIVMKALEKDRNRRYESASALAADMQRYLQDEPVEACPPSRRYRLGKFLRKHRRGVLTATVLLAAALALGAGVGYVLYDQASRLAKIGHNVAEALAGARAALEAGDLSLTMQRTSLAEGYLESERARLPFWETEISRVRLAITTRQASKLPQQVAVSRKAIELDSNDDAAYNSLGHRLYVQQKFPEAEAVYRKLIDIDSENAGAYHSLGNMLYFQHRYSEAVTASREAIKLKPRFANAYSTLGVILRAQQKAAEADEAQRKAIEINDGVAEANLGYLFMMQGQFEMAVLSFRHSREIIYTTYQIDQINQARAWLNLDAKLPKILNGEAVPADAAESFAWAEFCQLQCRQCYAVSARFYSQTFAADPTLVEDLRADIRYDAARAAALAGCSQGKDAGNLEANEYVRLRGRALSWLRADLAGWRRELDKEPDKARNGLRYEMRQWQHDASFNGVRGEAALAKLPEAERQEWRKLWEEVEELRKRAGEGK